jgi:hypothetical protein
MKNRPVEAESFMQTDGRTLLKTKRHQCLKNCDDCNGTEWHRYWTTPTSNILTAQGHNANCGLDGA